MTGINQLIQGRRFMFPFGVLLGIIMAGLQLRHGDVATAVFSIALMSCFGYFVAFSKSDVARVGSFPDSDERHRQLSLRVSSNCYLAVVIVAVPGALWELFSDGELGKFGIICTVGGLTQMISTVILSRRA